MLNLVCTRPLFWTEMVLLRRSLIAMPCDLSLMV